MADTTIDILEARIIQLESRLSRLEKFFPAPINIPKSKRAKKNSRVDHYMKSIRNSRK